MPVEGGSLGSADSCCVISSSHNDLAYVYLQVVDAEGNLCPTAEIPLEIKTSGARHNAIAGTGHPYDLQSFRSLSPTTFRGQALLMIQPRKKKAWSLSLPLRQNSTLKEPSTLSWSDRIICLEATVVFPLSDQPLKPCRWAAIIVPYLHDC